MTMSVVAVILAGGVSRRMGQDKAEMFGGVDRLKQCLAEAGIERSVVLCGDEERASLFRGEVLADPPHLNGLHRIIPWVRSQLEASILLVPCDAFLLCPEAISAFLAAASGGGVPLDETGQRQPLFAYLPHKLVLDTSATSATSLVQGLPSVDVGPYRSAFSNFNQPSDLQHPQLSGRQP